MHCRASITGAIPTGCLAFLATTLALAASPPADLVARDAFGQPGMVAGDIIELEADGETFAAVHQPAQIDQARGGAVLLPDRFGNPDSPEVVRPIRQDLPGSGWDTLSIQLPRSYSSESNAAWLARNPSMAGRAASGMNWFQRRGLKNQVVIAVGDASRIALDIATNAPPDTLQGLVMISAVLTPPDLELLVELAIPVLDLRAQRDSDAVVNSAEQRRALIRDKANIRQAEIAGARSDFAGTRGTLTSTVSAWLARHASGVETP